MMPCAFRFAIPTNRPYERGFLFLPKPYARYADSNNIWNGENERGAEDFQTPPLNETIKKKKMKNSGISKTD
jgi:hypothetical protein